MQNPGPHAGPLHQQEESVNSPDDSDTSLKAVTGRAGQVCVSESPRDLLKIHLLGLRPRWSWGPGWKGKRPLHLKEASW